MAEINSNNAPRGVTAAAGADKRFWSFRNSTETGGDAELVLYGSISSTSWWGDDVTPKQFSDDLKALGDIQALTVRINSGGGDVFAAFAIYNRLLDLRKKGVKVSAVVDGWAASAATVICMGAEKISIPAAAMFMIHDPAVGSFGYYKAEELEKMADELKTIKQAIVAAYAGKTRKSAEDISAAMAAETWMDGTSAVESGYCDELISAAENTAVENRDGHFFVNSVEMPGIPEKVLERFPALSTINNTINGAAGAAPAKKTTTAKDTTEPTEEQGMADIKDIAGLKAAYPDLCRQIENDAAKGERERIKAIEDATVEGFEDVAEKAKYTDLITAPEMAVRVLNGMKKQGADYLRNREQDAQDSGADAVQQQAPESPADDDDKKFNSMLDGIFGKEAK